ncbi:CDGSH iron-sulfur domain-containing protein [Micromonospora sp. NPDC050417]|uniref:CDGSH iron-sulfur domain-containing protein n=1 Tax=Micromonospora sp. NPDC050417 TaxID=3364280 RepID=UPI0037A3BEDC
MPRPTPPAASVTVYENGPLLIRGDYALRTALGGPIDPGRDTVALCRCGKSSLKPFCDGTHKMAGFVAGATPDPGPDPGGPGPASPHPDSGADEG